MDWHDVMLDLLRTYVAALRRTLEGMTQDGLTWQPDPEANDIAITVWHMSRALDILVTHLLHQQPAGEQLWFSEGWATRTGYDPRGRGWGGFGNLAGYTLAEVAAVPRLTADDLLHYMQQGADALAAALPAVSEQQLHQPAQSWPDEPRPTTYEIICNFLMDGMGHLGEIRAIKAMWERQHRG